ncbi:MAG: ATP-dependent DNA helicase RecG [Armatimonadota bacterium]|nr:ATP-dependent DNA helicase RecG [Armatimonadota bacterium]
MSDDSRLQEIFDKLRKPLSAEAKLGFDNTAVIGGLDSYIKAQTERALEGIAAGELPSTAEFTLRRLHALWSRYGDAGLDERHHLLTESLRLLDLPNGDRGSGIGDRAVELPMIEDGGSRIEDRESEIEHPAPDVQSPGARMAGGSKVQSPKAVSGASCNLQTELTYLKGIGPKRAQLLAKLGLHSVYDLLYYFPARYEDRRIIKPIAQLRVGEKESLCATVLYPAQTRQMGGRMGGRKLTRVRVGDATGRVDLQWWNQPFREKQLQPGMQLFIYGKVSEFNGFLQIDSPEFEVMGENDTLQVGRIVPGYPMTEGLFQTPVRRAVSNALENCADSLEEMLPESVRQKFDLPPLAWSLRQIHFPDYWKLKEEARARLVFEELFLLQVALAQKKFATHREEMGIRHIVEDDKIKQFVQALPFKLTGAQRRVMNEIRKDLRSLRPMNRLLHGDVGSGKTVVAAYALWTAHVTGHQGALLAPTEILSEQHFSVLTRLFKPMDIEVALLEGSLSTKQKRRIQADLNEGRTTIVVGTHALIQEGVEFNKLGVCVVDEQHRFGVMQRAALQNKGQDGARPDVLVMTATPIPRTMALTVYGDLEVSVLDELPPGRQPIKTVSLKPNKRVRAYQFILDEVKKGRQAYVVCPLVEESEKLAHLKAATALAERLRSNELKDVRVGLVHGQMSALEREEQMELFRAGMWDVLVSTTVIEVGVDVPNATVMLIEDAERFGLSQLHQLRGRVGRSEFKSTCVLLSDPRTDEGRARVSIMTKTQNGFEIAEHDLQLRGPGEFYGTRQSGMPDFRLANIIRDVDVIQQAREAAFELIQQDPHLEAEEHQPLRRALARFWGEKLSLVRVS